jgi:alpha-1,2-mannosyltransferase
MRAFVSLPPPGADFYKKFTVAGAVFFYVLMFIYCYFSAPGFWLPTADAFGSTAFGRDFLNTWMGGRSAFGEGPAAWFDFVAYNAYLKAFIGDPKLHDYLWSYPPHVLLLIWPAGLLPYLPSFLLWTGLGLALFLYTASSCGVERRNLLFIAIAPAVALNVFFGQNGFFTAALLIGGLANLDRRPVLSGILFGILTVKPQLGLLLPLVLVLMGKWRTIAAAAVTTAALLGASVLLYGPEIWLAYFEKVVPMQRWVQENGTGLLLITIPSFFYGFRLMGLPNSLGWGVQALGSVLTLAAVIWTFWRPRDPVLSKAFLVVAIFLFSPYTMNYDMVVFGWVIVMLRQHASLEPIDHYLMIAVWALAVLMMVVGLAHIPLAMLVLPAFGARLVWHLAQKSTARSSSAPVPEPAQLQIARAA